MPCCPPRPLGTGDRQPAQGLGSCLKPQTSGCTAHQQPPPAPDTPARGPPTAPPPAAPAGWSAPLRALAAPIPGHDARDQLFLRQRLDQALHAVARDGAWSDSGVGAYLAQALRLEREGCLEAAKSLAVEVAGFVELSAAVVAGSLHQQQAQCQAQAPPSRAAAQHTRCCCAAALGGYAPLHPCTGCNNCACCERHAACPNGKPPPQPGERPAQRRQQQPGHRLPVRRDSFGMSFVLRGDSSCSGAAAVAAACACAAPVAAGGCSAGGACSGSSDSGCSSGGVRSRSPPFERAGSTGSCDSSASSFSVAADAAATAVAAAAGAKRTERDHSGGGFAQPAPPKRARSMSPPQQQAHALPTQQQQQQQQQQPPVPQQPNWRGVLRHAPEDGGDAVDVAALALSVPPQHLPHFPAAELSAACVMHRRRVSLGRHVVVRCCLGAASARQMQGLALLAERQLVVVVPLEAGGLRELHLTPYLDNTGAVRVVGFLRIAEPAPAA